MQGSALGLRKLHPTGLVPDSLAAQVLEFMNQGGLGLLGLAASAEVVAADCRNDAWVVTEVKRAGLNDAEWLEFLELGERNQERAIAAMKAFATDKDEEKLCAVLIEVASQLNDRALPRMR